MGAAGAEVAPLASDQIDFNRDIRPILSNQCIACHGPDEHERKAGLRLDTQDGALMDLGGYAALVPGNPGASELLTRLTTDDEDERMPPKGKGERLKPEQIERIRRWIGQGGGYDVHWAYSPPKKSAPPEVVVQDWSFNEIDRFILARLQREGLQPRPEADLRTLARRVALDLTGLPPAWEEIEALERAATPLAYESFVDSLLARSAFGEYWATGWLDLARYADSSGYPSDQPREIWGYRDWVIDAMNRNLPFDRFTVEQLAGDLLPKPEESQLIATAFHRNTMTQNEGGTSDEEFRIAAIVDRVNTTMAVWMGTTMACAQCHTHKYDPVTQKDYYKFFAILNQSADADRKDETPVHSFFTAEQAQRRSELGHEFRNLEGRFSHPMPADFAGLPAWEEGLPLRASWNRPVPMAAVSRSGQSLAVGSDGRVFQPGPGAASESVSIPLPPSESVEAVRLEALADSRLPGGGPGHAGGNFVVSRVRAELVPTDAKPVTARRLRLELVSARYDFLALAEIQIFSGIENVAVRGQAKQISTAPNGQEARLAIDGRTNGDAKQGKSVSVTGGGESPQWWEVEFDTDRPVDRIVIWKRTDKGSGSSINELKLSLLNQSGAAVWQTTHKKVFANREEITVSGRQAIHLIHAFADATQSGFDPKDVLSEDSVADKGWAIAGFTGKDSALTLLPSEPIGPERPSHLVVTIDQQSQWKDHTLGSFRIALTSTPGLGKLAALPPSVLEALAVPPAQRQEADLAQIRDYYIREVAAPLDSERKRLAAARRELDSIRPATVPVMQEIPQEARRVTKVQLRGNWQNLGEEVQPGVPEAFPQLPSDVGADRLALANWLVDRRNPLTARVVVNRYWEALFGIGIVRTSEEFGSQGEPPVHPELLDWLAVDFMEHGWDCKRLLKQMVMSRAYRQDSRIDPTLAEKDPYNRLLARGPRFRPQGELLRDQALAVSGLLSRKMGGPAVRPVSPNLGLSTAFGRSNDWTTSPGEDRYRRAIYTEVRRNSPYASFATFDAPNREVCTIRRNRTNTPLQAFVTLNDPVFIEASQALARRILAGPVIPDTMARIRFGYRLCLSRDPQPSEVDTLKRLLETAMSEYRTSTEKASRMATEPLGPVPAGTDVAELAAWTVVCNVILNLDEFLMRR